MYNSTQDFASPSGCLGSSNEALSTNSRAFKTWRALALVALTGLWLLTACASMSHTECYYADWYAKGLVDGTKGEAIGRLDRYVSDCSKFAITPDRQDYLNGRLKGLESFCTEAHGYSFGRNGNYYENVCPASFEERFLDGYDPGYRLYQAEARVEKLDRDIDALKRRNNSLESEIDKFEDEILSEDTDDETRKTRLRQIERRQSEIARNRHRLDEYYSQKVFAVVEYRRVIEANRDLGFHEIEKY